MWWTRGERLTLAILGVAGLIGLGLLCWQRRHPPLTVVDVPQSTQATWDRALDAARRVDVNTATVAELERLPGIGPGLARRIADDRLAHGPFHSVEDLGRVAGLGPKTVAALTDYVTAQ